MTRVYEESTIAAIATATGGSIGVVRISGAQSFSIVKKIFSRSSKRRIVPQDFVSHQVYYGYIFDSHDRLVDEVILLPMKAPRSYTCEDVVEVQCHGGLRSVYEILELALWGGARLAEPGEFTKRAFLNGRIDLSQAEAVMDLINAKTELSQRHALNLLQGSLSDKIGEYRNRILAGLANIEANIDYPENDLEELSVTAVKELAEDLYKGLSELYACADTGKIIREGISTVILGRPNVGKSSFLNALLGESRAIVTNIPGTTRDVLSETVSLSGIPLNIADTAGIRETDDEIEKIGIEITRKYAENADLVLIVLDGAQVLAPEDIEVFKYVRTGGKKAVVLVNKSDLGIRADIEEIREHAGQAPVIEISAKNNTGIEQLAETVRELFLSGSISIEGVAFLNNFRQKDAVFKALRSLEHVFETIGNGLTSEFISPDLTDCYHFLGEITGESLEEDIIDRIFADFCLGK